MRAATQTLKAIGGKCKNRNQFAINYYRTANGNKSTRYAYAAVDRAIKAGEILLNQNGSIEVK